MPDGFAVLARFAPVGFGTYQSFRQERQHLGKEAFAVGQGTQNAAHLPCIDRHWRLPWEAGEASTPSTCFHAGPSPAFAKRIQARPRG